jgi:hypothetical protein
VSAKFCAQCGTGLGPADKFCAICGTKIISKCPTCGQAWDGVVNIEPSPSPKERVEEKPKPAVEKREQVEKPEPITVTKVAEQTGGNKPVYGSAFDKTKDCANCGSAGKKKACDVCGTGVLK